MGAHGPALAVLRRIHLQARLVVEERLAGAFRSRFRGSGIEFAELREYQPGDDIRGIDWNVTARTGRPHSKRFVEERELTVFFAVDFSGSCRATLGGGRRRLAEVVALLGLAAHQNGFRCGAHVHSDRLEQVHPVRRGIAPVLGIVAGLLQHATPRTATDLEGLVRGVRRTLRRPAVIFVLSDFEATEQLSGLRDLARHHDVVALALLPPATPLPEGGLLGFRDAESGERVEVDLSSRAARRTLAERGARIQEDRRQRLSSAGVSFVALDPTRSVQQPLLEAFAHPARRATL